MGQGRSGDSTGRFKKDKNLVSNRRFFLPIVPP
jgi:hypothetical protein